MADVTLYHHTGCSTSRKAVEAVKAAGVEPEVVVYLKSPLDREALVTLLGHLEDPPRALVRHDAFFTAQGLDPDGYTTVDAVADLLVEHPRLMQRPVLVRGDRAIIGRPLSRIDEFLA